MCSELKKILSRMSVLLKKYKMMISYLFFGVLTVLVNTAAYGLFYHRLGISNFISTILAWIAAVLFAYVTNKLFVFESHRDSFSGQCSEFFKFVACRALTGVLDVVIMVAAVDVLNRNAMIWKFISNVLVTVINYFASRFYIFRKHS